MRAMRVIVPRFRRRSLAGLTSLFLALSILAPVQSNALSFNSAPARFWGHIYAGNNEVDSIKTAPRAAKVEGEAKSEWRVTYKDFPADAKEAVQYAIDIWSRNFSSKVPINVEATWETNANNYILGSARPGYFFNDFPGAPDSDLWYPSALANSLANRDLDPNQIEIFLNVNSTPLWHTGTDGKPGPRSYDLVSVILHEVAHGLGFLSNAEYDRFFGTGYMFQPTPFDAYVELPDGRKFTDFCSRSADLGKAMINPLYWSGTSAIAANRGSKPKLYTPTSYEEGSSITHLDEDLFSKSLTDAAMTPNLDPGEVFRSPGPIALAMIEDMLKKPPLGNATGLPAKPVNLRALVGDKYALLTFDSPNCSRVDRIKSYTVKISPGGETKTFNTTPIRINGLKNGKSYKFSLVAENDKGSSEPVESNSVKPQASGSITTVDNYSKVSHIAATNYLGNNVIVYGDESSQTLKIATRSGTKWKIATARRGVDVGQISLCVSGSGSKQSLHVIYSELKRQDLILSSLKSGKWSHETIDGNGNEVQDYREEIRKRTASDVSVSNACAVTNGGLQVFYRDETQGILLGAVKTSTGWVYEIVDGDRTTNNRTTGDVAFSLSATTDKNTVYLIYDSVLTINSSRQATEGEVRIASRKTIFPEDWRYTTIDGPVYGNAVAGYATAIFNNRGTVTAAWLTAKGDTLPNPTQVAYSELNELGISNTITPSNLGTPSAPISIDGKGISFGCLARLCKVALDSGSAKLANGSDDFSKNGQLITVSKARYMATSINKKLVLVRI